MDWRRIVWAGLLLLGAARCGLGQTPAARPRFETFEVATVKPVDVNLKDGRMLRMEGPHRFVARNFTLKLLIAAAYDLNPRTISGGPPWFDSDHFVIEAVTPGEARPSRVEQMTMLRSLLAERFKLTFHRERKEFSIYVLEVAKGGPKLKPSAAGADEPPALVNVVYPQKIDLPARNATMADFVAMLQRALLDRPVVDKTGLTGRYDFDLEWAPDETQFGGEVPVAKDDAPSPPFFSAIQQQLGLKMDATRGPVDAMVVDKAERPTSD